MSTSSLPVHMTSSERDALERFLDSASSYVEFGCGGSTVLACQKSLQFVVSLDSSHDWIAKTWRACQRNGKLVPQMIFADIGPVGEWGRPVDESCKHRWPIYSAAVWDIPQAEDADFFLIDGRFRVACFLETILRCRADAVVAIHDYPERREYHVVEQFARPLMTTDSLTAFVPRAGMERAKVQAMLPMFTYQPG